jgi:hypothetical protein
MLLLKLALPFAKKSRIKGNSTAFIWLVVVIEKLFARSIGFQADYSAV